MTKKQKQSGLVGMVTNTKKCRQNLFIYLQKKHTYISTHSLLSLSFAGCYVEIVFNQVEHEALMLLDIKTHHARPVRRYEMESDDTVQRRGLVAMTLKRGTPCSAPVKCIKKALPTQSQHAGQMTLPHTAGSSACLSNIQASVHVTFLYSHYLSP